MLSITSARLTKTVKNASAVDPTSKAVTKATAVSVKASDIHGNTAQNSTHSFHKMLLDHANGNFSNVTCNSSKTFTKSRMFSITISMLSGVKLVSIINSNHLAQQVALLQFHTNVVVVKTNHSTGSI